MKMRCYSAEVTLEGNFGYRGGNLGNDISSTDREFLGLSCEWKVDTWVSHRFMLEFIWSLENNSTRYK